MSRSGFVLKLSGGDTAAPNKGLEPTARMLRRNPDVFLLKDEIS
jgi:hypothetical protein